MNTLAPILRPLISIGKPLSDFLIWRAGFFAITTFFLVPFFLELPSHRLFVVSLLWYFIALLLRHYASIDDAQEFRGRRMYTPEEVATDLRKEPKEKRPFFWGGQYIPADWATYHFYAMGSTGGGKSLSLQMLLKSVLDQFGTKDAARIIAFDAKREIIPVFDGAGLTQGKDYFVLHPFETRSVAWDIAEDVTDAPTALHVARAFVPEKKGDQNAFFSDAATRLLYAVLIALQEKKKKTGQSWSLYDVITACSGVESVRATLEQSPLSKDIIGSDLDDDRLARDVLATLRNPLELMRVVAAAWEPREKISLTRWLETRSVLVLPFDDSISEICRSFIGVAVTILSSTLQTELVDDPEKSWLFFDELADAGELHALNQILRKGRGYGLCTVLAFQDIESLYTVYDEHRVKSLLNNCANKSFFRLEGKASAEFASNIIGDVEYIDTSETESFGQQYSHSVNRSTRTRRAVTPEMLYQLPAPGQDSGLHGIHILRSSHTYGMTLPWDDVLKRLPKRATTPAYSGIDRSAIFDAIYKNDGDSGDPHEGESLAIKPRTPDNSPSPQARVNPLDQVNRQQKRRD